MAIDQMTYCFQFCDFLIPYKFQLGYGMESQPLLISRRIFPLLFGTVPLPQHHSHFGDKVIEDPLPHGDF